MKAKEVDSPVVSSLPNHIAANLRILRKRQGWSQAQLAERAGLNRGNIASYESGSAEPSICKMLRFSNLFKINARDLTRRDLSQPEELLLAEMAHDATRLKEKERLAAYRSRALELEELVRSGHRLHEYKKASLTDSCKEADIFAAQYQQLYDLAQQLLGEHRALLAEMGCECQ